MNKRKQKGTPVTAYRHFLSGSGGRRPSLFQERLRRKSTGGRLISSGVEKKPPHSSPHQGCSERLS